MSNRVSKPRRVGKPILRVNDQLCRTLMRRKCTSESLFSTATRNDTPSDIPCCLLSRLLGGIQQPLYPPLQRPKNSPCHTPRQLHKQSLISNSIMVYSPRYHPILPTIYLYHTIPIRHDYINMIIVPAHPSQSKECKMQCVIQKKAMIATQTKPTRYANNKDPGRRYNSRKREEKKRK